MKKRLISSLLAVLVVVAVLALPVAGRAQTAAQEDNGIFVLGSVLLSILHVPVKLVTCVGTQAGAAVAYTATFGVAGHYDGGTNGKEIGETARRSCTGSWFITPSQVKSDYGS
jgi:Mn2+/Fe2+ NRAMP family transporter